MFLFPSEPTEAKDSLDDGFGRLGLSLQHQERVQRSGRELETYMGLKRKDGQLQTGDVGCLGIFFDCINSFPLPMNISDVSGQKVNHRYYLQTVREHLRIQTLNKIHLGLNNDCK